jgi:uncharacterized protein (UPF0248 family)
MRPAIGNAESPITKTLKVIIDLLVHHTKPDQIHYRVRTTSNGQASNKKGIFLAIVRKKTKSLRVRATESPSYHGIRGLQAGDKPISATLKKVSDMNSALMLTLFFVLLDRRRS